MNNQKDIDVLSIDSMNQVTNGLRLKRTKPFVATKNTLEKCMNLKVVKDENENEYDDEQEQQDQHHIDEIYENA